MGKIRLLLVDDHPVVRAGVRMLLSSQNDMEVVGEATDGGQGVESAVALKPDVVIMDITLGAMNGIEATRQIRERVPGTRVLVLTMHENAEYLRQVLGAGATGYVVKRAASSELAVAIRAVHRGEVFVYPTLTRVLLDDFVGKKSESQGEPRHGLDRLTERERQVLRLVAHGYTSRQIANTLFLSVRTVETYRARLMRKLNLNSRVNLVRFALENGLLDGDATGTSPADES